MTIFYAIRMFLIYDVYEIAPYAAGEQDLMLHFGQLEELFKAEFRQGNDI